MRKNEIDDVCKRQIVEDTSAQWNDRRVCIGGIYWSLCLRLRNTNAYHQRDLGTKDFQVPQQRLTYEHSTSPQCWGLLFPTPTPQVCCGWRDAHSLTCLPNMSRDMSRQMSIHLRGPVVSKRNVKQNTSRGSSEKNKTTEHASDSLHKNGIKNI